MSAAIMEDDPLSFYELTNGLAIRLRYARWSNDFDRRGIHAMMADVPAQSARAAALVGDRTAGAFEDFAHDLVRAAIDVNIDGVWRDPLTKTDVPAPFTTCAALSGLVIYELALEAARALLYFAARAGLPGPIRALGQLGFTADAAIAVAAYSIVMLECLDNRAACESAAHVAVARRRTQVFGALRALGFTAAALCRFGPLVDCAAGFDLDGCPDRAELDGEPTASYRETLEAVRDVFGDATVAGKC